MFLTIRNILVFFQAGVAFSVACADGLQQATNSPQLPKGRIYEPMFTTAAYQQEALKLVLQEANRVAKELDLTNELPIAKSNIVKFHIAPYGYASRRKAIGNVTTKKYVYFVSKGNKFSYLEGTHQDEDCWQFEASYTWPRSKIDTNQAYQMASQWLANVAIDVKALNKNCILKIDTDNVYVHPASGKFVPVYYVSWVDHQRRGVAGVRLFTPTKTLLQLRVEDPNYILRKPIEFTNLDLLLSQTNGAANTDR